MTVEVRSLTKFYGTTKAVDDLSFTIGEGEVLGFVGPNGSGKTTTMNIMATLDEPSSGDVLIDGKSVIDYPDYARRVIGFMPDYIPSQNDISAHEYIDFFARAHGLKGAQLKHRVREIEKFANIWQIRDKVISELSRGMKQRLSLARSIVHDPELLIMDEPANGLDPRARIEFRAYVKRLAAEGKAVLISSHILADLAEICTGCMIIERGRLVKSLAGDIKSMDLESAFMEFTRSEVEL